MAASIGTNNPVGRLYVDHGSVGSTTWPVRIQNPNTSFVASLRVTNDGFFDVTSHAPSGSSFARLSNSGNGCAVSDRRRRCGGAPMLRSAERLLQRC